MSLQGLTLRRLLGKELVDRELGDAVANRQDLRRIVALPKAKQALFPVDDTTRLGNRLVFGLVAQMT